jgi:hypothetical protein
MLPWKRALNSLFQKLFGLAFYDAISVAYYDVIHTGVLLTQMVVDLVLIRLNLEK